MIFGGVYPNNYFENDHYKALKEVNDEMIKNFKEDVIDFLSCLDDGSGKWKEGTYEDAGHPNTKGHEEMFKAINFKIFDI